MTISKHFNHDDNSGKPIGTGDKYYAQDLQRDFWYMLDRIGLSAQDLLKRESKVIVSGGEVSQVFGTDTIDISALIGYIPFNVTVWDTPFGVPGSTTTEDLEMVRVSMAAQSGYNISTAGATLDGSTVNYLKVAYNDANDADTRARQHATGSYNYAKTPSFTLSINSTAPTSYELLLATIVSAGSGAVMTIKQNTLDGSRSFSFPSDVFETNYSINWKEDSEDTSAEKQFYFNEVPYGRSFASIDQSKCRTSTLQQILVPPQSPELSLSGFSLVTNASAKFGEVLQSTSANSTIILTFVGHNFWFGIEGNANVNTIKVEISKDGGTTYEREYLVANTPSLDEYHRPYPELEYREWTVRLTHIRGSSLNIDWFSYGTRMIQRPISQYYAQATAVDAVTDIPPGATLLTGTWTTKNDNNTLAWNTTQSNTTTANDTAEMRMKSKYFWVLLGVKSVGNVDIAVTVNGGTAGVKNTTINLDNPSVERYAWVRLDDGTLDPSVTHEWKIEHGAGTDNMAIMGWAWYDPDSGERANMTDILGEESYAVGVDDAGFSFTGAGWGGIADNATSFLRRRNTTTTDTDYVEYTTPNPASGLKAVYAFVQIDNTAGDIEITIAGGDTRNLTLDSTAYALNNFMIPLYDADIDGIALENKVIRITKAGGTNFRIEGLVFEIGDAFGKDQIFAMPKWSRFNSSSNNFRTPVSSGKRLEVKGVANDNRPGRAPIVHTGWIFIPATTTFYFDLGLGLGLDEMLLDAVEDVSSTGTTILGAVQRTNDPELLGYNGGSPDKYQGNNDMPNSSFIYIVGHPGRVV